MSTTIGITRHLFVEWYIRIMFGNGVRFPGLWTKSEGWE